MNDHENDDSINALRRGEILVTGLKADLFAWLLFEALREMRSPAVLARDKLGNSTVECTDDVALIKSVPFRWTVSIQVSAEELADVVVHSNDGSVGFITKGARSGTIVDLGRIRQRQEREGSLP